MSKGGGGSSIPSDYTIKVGSDGSTIHVDTDLDNIHLKEIAPVTINSNVAVTQPIVTNSTSKSDSTANLDLKVEPLDIKMEPLQVSTDSAIDVKPLAIDSCQTLKLAPLPPIKIEQPYSQHFGMTFMGMEMWGFNMSGKSEMFLHSPPKSHHFSSGTAGSCDCCGEHAAPTSRSTPAQSGSGLRVRVK